MVKTILLVDDDNNLINSVTELLRTRGYFVLENSDPREAMESCRPIEDVSVVDDTDIPEVDGIPLVSEVRRIHTTVEQLLLTGELRWWGPPSSDDADCIESLSYDELFQAREDTLAS